MDSANAASSRPEQVRAFRVLASGFSVQSGELTATFKLKRVITTNYEDAIEALYARL